MPEHSSPGPPPRWPTEPDGSVAVGSPSPAARSLYCATTATTGHARRTRRTLRGWVDALDLAQELAEDLVLAVHEALTNVVDHAYLGRTPGPMTLLAQCAGAGITVTVSDRGHWRTEGSAPEDRRGRGLPLIRALAPTVTFDIHPSGTAVHIHHPSPGHDDAPASRCG